jgi:four helix bundle protein
VERVQSYRDLIVWNKAMDLVVEVYRVSALFPASERWRLIDQISRAVVSVPANIAEGQGRGTAKDLPSF